MSDYQRGDLWRDRDGDLWFALALVDGTSLPELVMVCWTGLGMHLRPEVVAGVHGPLTLVRREEAS